LQYKVCPNTFGDQLTPFVAANLFNVNVHVISTLSPKCTSHTFQSIASNAMPNSVQALTLEAADLESKESDHEFQTMENIKQARD